MEQRGPMYENPKVFKLVKKLVFCLLLLLFFTTSFLIHVLQLINYLLLKKIFPDLRRFLNNYLQNVIQSSFIYIFEWQCPISFRVSFDSQETMNLFCGNDENALLVANHGYPLDVFFYHIFGEMTNSLNSMKGFAKSSIKYMPIVGWMFYFNDTIFLKRNWQQDEQTIKEKLERLKRSKMPYKLLIAPEGTRFTAEKYKISQEFIAKHGLDVKLKHHLCPRVKGFAATLRQMNAKNDPHFSMYNIELVSQVDEKYAEPTIENFFKGKSFRGDFFVGKIANSEVPDTDADDLAYADFLYRTFEKKDALVEVHQQYHKFPGTVVKVRKQSGWRTLKFVLFNIIFTGSMFAYGLYLAWALQSLTLKVGILSYVTITFSAILATFRMSEISDYGTKKPE